MESGKALYGSDVEERLEWLVLSALGPLWASSSTTRPSHLVDEYKGMQRSVNSLGPWRTSGSVLVHLSWNVTGVPWSMRWLRLQARSSG